MKAVLEAAVTALLPRTTIRSALATTGIVAAKVVLTGIDSAPLQCSYDSSRRE